MPDPTSTGDRRLTLVADCSSCFGLCCVAPAFTASADFAITKPAGRSCPHLGVDFGCGIHAHLRDRGFPGCTVFDCLGAGQKVAQVTFGGRSWRDDPSSSSAMFDVFHVVRELHELLWYLAEALSYPTAQSLFAELAATADQIDRFTQGTAEQLVLVDLATEHARVNALLLRVSELVRAAASAGRGRRRGLERRGADLIGQNLTRTVLRGANLRGSYLIGADLRGVDLAWADLTGADLRGAELAGADLSQSLFLTQPQVAAASGDHRTRLPVALRRPRHWTVDPATNGAG